MICLLCRRKLGKRTPDNWIKKPSEFSGHLKLIQLEFHIPFHHCMFVFLNQWKSVRFFLFLNKPKYPHYMYWNNKYRKNKTYESFNFIIEFHSIRPTNQTHFLLILIPSNFNSSDRFHSNSNSFLLTHVVYWISLCSRFSISHFSNDQEWVLVPP